MDPESIISSHAARALTSPLWPVIGRSRRRLDRLQEAADGDDGDDVIQRDKNSLATTAPASARASCSARGGEPAGSLGSAVFFCNALRIVLSSLL
jgi:hypothetical protein